MQNVWVSKCLDLYAVAQCLGGIMSGWQNVLVSKCLGARISCSHNVWVSKRGVSKCPGVEMSGAEMSENPENTPKPNFFEKRKKSKRPRDMPILAIYPLTRGL